MKKTILAVAATVLLTSNAYAEVREQGESLWWTSNTSTHQATNVKHQEKVSTRSSGVEFFQMSREN